MPYERADEDADFIEDAADAFGGRFEGTFQYRPVEATFDPATLTHVAVVAHAALLARGATRFRVTYDGGHDEGFARADTIWFGDGPTPRTPADVAEAWAGEADLVAELQAAVRRRHAESVARYTWMADHPVPTPTPREAVQDGLESCAWAIAFVLLGDGFGTGEYALYGACVVDLRTNRITDDPGRSMPPGLS